MNDNKAPCKSSLAFKLNLATTAMILLVAVGMLMISYYVQARRIDQLTYQRVEEAALHCANRLWSETLENLIAHVETEEFANVRQRAIAEDRPELIEEWMRGKPSVYLNWEDRENLPAAAGTTLLDDYSMIVEPLVTAAYDEDVTYIYTQYMKNGVTYNLVDLDLGYTAMGTVEEAVPEFSGYGDNESVPPTVYRSRFGWLCSAYHSVYNDDNKPIAMVGADIDMNDVIGMRHAFLFNSLALVLLLTAFCIVLNLFLIRRIAIRPLRQLTDATCGFAEGNKKLTKDDVIEVDIHSHDEINELYHEIRGMQTRIVDYTDDLARLTAEKARTATELNLAADIQEAMLPSIFPAFPEREEFDLYASMDPAKEVGGDFYDFFLTDDKHLVLLIADVSGKGVPGALFMMSSMILLKNQARTGGTPAEILSAVNEQICQGNKAKMFVTVWMGILDIQTGKMLCTNAGHEYPALRGEDGVFRIFKDKHGFVVGGMEGIPYRNYELTLKPGDVLFVYTDGVPEASNTKEEFYGTDRLLEALNAAGPACAPQEYVSAVRRSVDAFSEGAEQFDDMTILCLSYRGAQDEGSGDMPKANEESKSKIL